MRVNNLKKASVISILNMKKITELLLKFTENLDFKEKSSRNTVIAYSVDLQQVFRGHLPGKLRGPSIDGSETYFFENDRKLKEPALPLDPQGCEQLLRQHLMSLKNLENSTRARKIAAIKKFWLYLQEENIVSELPKILVAPKVSHKIPHFISLDEVIAILQLFRKLDLNVRDIQSQVLFLLLYGCGLRVSEACHLKWNHIDLQKRALKIRGKGNKERIVSMPVLTQKMLMNLKQSSTGEFVWGDKPLQTRTAYNYILRLGQKALLHQPIHPHALRHSFATHLLNDGADLRIIQELLGHSSLSSTEKYTHVSLDQLSQTMEAFHPLAKKIS